MEVRDFLYTKQVWFLAYNYIFGIYSERATSRLQVGSASTLPPLCLRTKVGVGLYQSRCGSTQNAKIDPVFTEFGIFLEWKQSKAGWIIMQYLDEKEIKILNNIVSGYFDFAEIMALEHKPVYMMDYVKQLDSILMSTGRPLLQGTGSVSHEEAMEKALAEYCKYQVKTLSLVEQAYLDSIKMLGKKGKRE